MMMKEDLNARLVRKQERTEQLMKTRKEQANVNQNASQSE